MSQKHLVKLVCSVCGASNYYTHRNTKSVTEKLSMLKYCRHDRKRTLHKEQKVKSS